ncbi:twin-arginine translocase subunit TatC [Tuberibacillus sp. Marseille-P3662]|uniref:twin-arginine translocase subunit TatC n=1 Tax=Tuberibacillus sp. Marseille-P3662 TaxID=1965358 RepID=UPI000A1C8D53|nr:twin-arginine translocase subunit TatC [Tuberibacillus sp. Marseille-P3662]
MENKTSQMIDHLEELRNRMIMTILAFLGFVVGGLIFVNPIYQWLIRDLDMKLAVLGPSDILWVYLMIATIIALAATIPIAAFQVWRFIAPALTREESKVTLKFIPALFFLFIFGIAFGYFLLFPILLDFLTSLSEGQFNLMFTVDKYFRFMITLTLPFGLLFEMPLVVLFLTRLDILNPMRLRKARKMSYFVLIIVSVLITPPDFLSDILVIIPLLVLYEISVTLSNVVYKKQLKRREALSKTAA